MRTLISAIFLLFLYGCASLTSHSTPPSTRAEIFHHPAILQDRSVSPDEMLLWSVKLGDPQNVIAESRISHRAEGGWIICDDGSRYRIVDGSVATLGVWNRHVIDSFNVKSTTDLEAQFGKPESVVDAEPLKIYRYAGGRMSVLWNEREGQINAVNISR